MVSVLQSSRFHYHKNSSMNKVGKLKHCKLLWAYLFDVWLNPKHLSQKWLLQTVDFLMKVMIFWISGAVLFARLV